MKNLVAAFMIPFVVLGFVAGIVALGLFAGYDCSWRTMKRWILDDKKEA